MSIVLAVVTDSYGVMMSDGRVTSQTGSVASENYKKMLRFGSNIIVGYAGTQRLCEMALQRIQNPEFPTFDSNVFKNIDDMYNLLKSISNSIISEYKNRIPDAKIMMTIMGRVMPTASVHIFPIMKLCSFNTLRPNQDSIQIAKTGGGAFISLSPDNVKSSLLDDCLHRHEPLSPNSIKDAMKDCIIEASHISNTINTNCFCEEL